LKRLRFIIIFFIIAFLLASCGIKIETGQTKEEAKASSRITANKIKSDWARLIDSASPSEVGFHLKNHLDNISSKMIEYGFGLADKWREGNQGRGEPIPDSEMRTVIENWVTGDKQIINAWEDNTDYARRRLTEDGFYTLKTIDYFDEMIEQFNAVYSAVLYPVGDVDKYEDRLIYVKAETEDYSRDLKIELDRY